MSQVVAQIRGRGSVQEALAGFGGTTVLVGFSSTAVKAPTTPSQTALSLHEYCMAAGWRDSSSIALVMPFATRIPPSAPSGLGLAAFAEGGIDGHPNRSIT
jgi:hypothetical protein